MSTKNHGNTHNLLFQDYKFPLEDRAFLDTIAFSHYDGAGKGKRLSDQLRETLRVLTAYPGFKAQYAVHVTDASITPKEIGAKLYEFRSVREHIALLGQKDLPFAVIEILNGPAMAFTEKALPPVELAKAFEAKFKEATNVVHPETGVAGEWWMSGEEGSVFQCATLAYEIRRVLLDLSTAWEGVTYKDNHGKVHLNVTQKGDVQFADERLTVQISIIPSPIFNAAVIELSEKEQAPA